jgi:hypothetical protein
LLIPLGLAGVCLSAGVTAGLVFVLSVSWLLSVLGLWLRRFFPMVASALLLLLAYWTLVFAQPARDLFWLSICFGIGLFAMLELGHDCVSVSHGRLSLRAYTLRGRYIAKVAVADLAAVFLLATIAYNVALRFPDLPFSVAVLPALFVAVGGSAYLIYRLVKGRQ